MHTLSNVISSVLHLSLSPRDHLESLDQMDLLDPEDTQDLKWGPKQVKASIKTQCLLTDSFLTTFYWFTGGPWTSRPSRRESKISHHHSSTWLFDYVLWITLFLFVSRVTGWPLWVKKETRWELCKSLLTGFLDVFMLSINIALFFSLKLLLPLTVLVTWYVFAGWTRTQRPTWAPWTTWRKYRTDHNSSCTRTTGAHQRWN